MKELILKTVSEVLGISKIEYDLDLTEIGLDSLNCIDITIRIEDKLDKRAPIERIGLINTKTINDFINLFTD